MNSRGDFVLCFFLLVIGLQILVKERCDGRTGKRTNPEYPDNFKSLSVVDKCIHNRGAERTGGVNGRSGEADAEDVNKDKRKTDYETCEGTVVAFLRSHAENCEHEDKCEKAFHQKTGTDSILHAAEAVGAVTAGGHILKPCRLENQRKKACARKRSETLGDPVAEHLF